MKPKNDGITRILGGLNAQTEEPLFTPLEKAFGLWCYERGGENADVGVSAALVLRAARLGNSCLALEDILPFVGVGSIGELEGILKASPLVGLPDDAPRPLVLDKQSLYTYRYYLYEKRLAERLVRFLKAPPEPIGVLGDLLDNGALLDGDSLETDWQAVFTLVAERHRFAVLLGGPGTGKTYCVLLVMLRMIALALKAKRRLPTFRLAAPTGKAAERIEGAMAQELRSAKDEPKKSALWPIVNAIEASIGKDILDVLPKEAVTLHRLLGLGLFGTLPAHNEQNPIPADVVIVDEASMVDLPLMAKLFSAIRPQGRLILLGDPRQLASVETGSVLSDLEGILKNSPPNAFSLEQRQALWPLLKGDAPSIEPCWLLSDHTVTLQKSRRFPMDSPIASFARAVNLGDVQEALGVLRGSVHVGTLLYRESIDLKELVDEMAQYYRKSFIKDGFDPEEILKRLGEKKLLCATRTGPFGSERLNLLIGKRLQRQKWAYAMGEPRPIIIVENDYRAGLFNGDTGIILGSVGARPRAYFFIDGTLRSFLPSSLPPHETAYAMTVHKSQGSEFNEVILTLPDPESPLLTRELLYTAITRAKKSVRILGLEASLIKAIATPTKRRSGLKERLLEGIGLEQSLTNS